MPAKGDYPYRLWDLYPLDDTYAGMSGSPVLISDMIVGVLQAEATDNRAAPVLIEMILDGSIDRSFAIQQIPTLSDVYDTRLADYVYKLFCELNEVYLAEHNEEDVEGLYPM